MRCIALRIGGIKIPVLSAGKIPFGIVPLVGKLALALESGTGSKRLLLRGIARDDTWSFTPGAQLYVDTTAGTITETRPSGSGDFVQVVGWAKTATIIFFEPSPDYAEV